MGRTPGARLARLALVPFAGGYRAVMGMRALAYRTGALRRRRPALRTVAVGNLSVGGTGKTPFCLWMAERYVSQGVRPAVLLRGVGGDETLFYRQRLVGGTVVVGADRLAGARRARSAGARVAVLDDAFQRLDLVPDLNVVLVSVESLAAPSWMVPAGPWRERWSALRRADLIVVTRKAAPAEASSRLARRLRAQYPEIPVVRASFELACFEGLRSGAAESPGMLAGRRLIAACGIADPDSFAAQLRAFGASVRLRAWPDHHPFGPADVKVLLQAMDLADYVVVTEKDAVKLRALWPKEGPEPLVGALDVAWDEGLPLVAAALDAVAGEV